jgi:hypothetical protein
MPYLFDLALCIACPPAAVLVIPTFALLAALQLIVGTLESVARATARRRLKERLAAEVRERRRIEARANERSEFLRRMYAPRPSTAEVIIPAMRLTQQHRASILGRIIAFVLVAALAVVIFGLA